MSQTHSVRVCGQCEKRYHFECLGNNAVKNRYQQEYWFCGDACQQIFCFLHKIIGKPQSVGTENLTWTLVKYTKSKSYDNDGSDDDCLVEAYSKLNVALNVMHECFEPFKEPSIRRGLVEEVIFSRRSELNRLNFQGFYTVLLEGDDELISTATVRIYGKSVAEVPLVATRFHHRRLWMCRILMDELEKNLIELGLERLVLPADPSSQEQVLRKRMALSLHPDKNKSAGAFKTITSHAWSLLSDSDKRTAAYNLMLNIATSTQASVEYIFSKKFHKFIGVSAGECALKSLNRSDIAGKRINLEPS